MTKESVNEILKGVTYPGFTKDIVTFGFVKDIEVNEKRVFVQVDISSSAPEVAAKLQEDITT